MKISQALKSFIEESKQGNSYWAESAKLQFALALERQRKAVGMTYRAIAEKLGSSPAYVSKVFRGDSNMTIESMVKLARATGGSLEVTIVDTESAATKWNWQLPAHRRPEARATDSSATGVVIGVQAVNDDKFMFVA